MFAALPSTTNYGLNSYSFGSGGGANSSSSNYALEGSSGTVAGDSTSTPNYTNKPEYIQTQQAHVPKIGTFDNGSGSYYNKLHFVLDTQNNPADALYALSISTDNFASDIKFVKADFTVGATLNTTDYLSYASWGGASGANIIGLTPNTTYYLRAKATQGKFTESGYGPVASAATVGPTLSFSISATTEAFGTLLAGTVVDAPSEVDLTFSTNAASGGYIYISGQNNGLNSATTSNTIPSSTGDLGSLNHGYGGQITSVGQASGGPVTVLAPYNGVSDDVGIVDTTIRKMASSLNPVTSGTASLLFKAKASSSDQSANDYRDVVTVLTAASF